MSPLQAPALAAGGGQANAAKTASTAPVAPAVSPSPAGAVAGTPATVAPAASPSTSAAGAQLIKRCRGRPPKVRDLEKLRESYPHPDSSPILDYEEEERDERLEAEVEVEVEILEEVEKVEANLETLCLQIIIMMNDDEMAVAAAQVATKDPWDPDDPLCQAYLLKLDRGRRLVAAEVNMRNKYRDFMEARDDEEEEGGGEEVEEDS